MIAYPFKDDQLYCIMDYETYSEADIKSVGAHDYAAHPSTEILCVAWRIGTRATLADAPIRSWCPHLGHQPSRAQSLADAIDDEDVVLVAHNAFFEQAVTHHVLTPEFFSAKLYTPVDRWLCTASLSRALALPGKLEGAAQALSLPTQKDMQGHRLMLKLSKPRKPTKHNSAKRHLDPVEMQRLVDYCVADVAAETQVFLKCPPLSPKEREVWLLDQAINWRGFAVDRPLVDTVLGMIGTELDRLAREVSDLTLGEIDSPNQRGAILKWLQDGGLHIQDLQAATVDEFLARDDVTGDLRTMLEFRRAASKTSTAKYVAFEARSRYDGRCRDNLVYHTAATGRWGGSGVQPQNFPRGIKNAIEAVPTLKSGDLEYIRMMYGNPLEIFASCLRNMIVPSQGCVFDVADYASIEVRVLFWMADHKDGIAAFFAGRPIYEEQAAKIFGIPVKDVTEWQRFFGKQSILGCGYAMGADTFQESCRKAGREIDDELAKNCVYGYRDAHKPVVDLWREVERAAMAAVRNPGSVHFAGKCKWRVKSGFLWCRLPSGRKLAYSTPRIKRVVDVKLVKKGERAPYGYTYDDAMGAYVKEREVLTYYGTDTWTKKWSEQRTYGGKLVENIVQATARDFMADAMLRIEAAGPWRIVLSVHDELVAERHRATAAGGTLEEFCELMETSPQWGVGCPIKVEGWSGDRYRK